MDIKRTGSQPSTKGFTDYFTGSVRFEPGSRTALIGQILTVTTGCGLAQRWNGPIEEIRAGVCLN